MLAFNFQSVFPFFTTFFSFLFFISVMEQYSRKKKFHQLIWGIAMFLFLVTAGAEAVALALGYWNPIVFKMYYVLAAIQVPFMGGGVLYLFAERNIINGKNSWKALIIFSLIWSLFGFLFAGRDPVFYTFFLIGATLIVFSVLYAILPSSNGLKEWWKEKVTGWTVANIFMAVSLLAFALMTYYAIISPVNLELLKHGGEVSGLPWQKDPTDLSEPRAVVRLFSPLQTVPGGIALIGGGFYSYISWQLSIKRQTGRFEWQKGFFNIYIAVGALVLGQGAFFSGFGYGTLYISETISVALMYFGFLESDRITKEQLVQVFNLRRFFRREVSVS
ncbi:MAG: hypothetical protein D6732_21480 [Methanobacteriota archaeon]|nr:MAG: hypothetical protein D6732_21480 [Euryarchaeota archaeon]